ncbi:hypothetical protein [Helicobacter bizzozeronii]|uniref:hypothetical protein n=1 Tax=Helicobacter bizzozeronii TaxID=56877 RepID=UPI000CF18B27|nr:hypothetical protein [Helicobacter bizzozeronii]
MVALLYGVVALGISLLVSLGALAHYYKQAAIYKDRLIAAQKHLDTQNAQIKSLELDWENYNAQKPQQLKRIEKHYQHIHTQNLRTCQEKLDHAEQLLEAFKSVGH